MDQEGSQNQSASPLKVASYTGGMNLDSHVSVNREKTYPYAKNIVNRDHYQREFVSNEHSHTFLSTLASKRVGSIYIKESDWIVHLLQDGSLYYQSCLDDSVTFICRDQEFNCTWDTSECEEVNIQYITKNCDTFVYWSSKLVYYWVNISEMLNPKRKATLIQKLNGDCKECNANCNYFKVFRPKKTPTTQGYSSNSGGSLPAGAYVAHCRLVNFDGGATNWNTPSKPEYTGSEHNIPGESGTGIVRFTFENLDCEFQKIEIAITSYTGSGIITRVQPIVYYTSSTYTFTYNQETGIPIDTSEVLINGQMNLRGRDLFPYKSRMYYYNTEPESQYNYQPHANNIELSWYAKKYPLEIAKQYNIPTYPRGEAIAVGIVLNWDDGSHTSSWHVPASGGSGNTNDPDIVEAVGSDDLPVDIPSPDGTISFTDEPEYLRIRSPKPNTVSDLNNDDALTDIENALVGSYNTDINDLVAEILPAITPPEEECLDCPDELKMFANVKKDTKDAALVAKDINTAEEIGVKWASLLGDYIGEEGKKDLIANFTPSTIKEVALDIINSIKKRERITIKGRSYEVNKQNLTYDLAGESSKSGPGSDNTHTSRYVVDFPGGEIIAQGAFDVKTEASTYPCIRDCDGNFIYGNLRNTPIKHPKFPTEKVIPHFTSNSVGVPSEATPDVNEHSDGYVIVLGLNVDNIYLPTPEETGGRRLNPANPYTITQVPITDANKTILTKGITFGNDVSSNKGKNYAYVRNGNNSQEIASRYIDIDGSRIDPGATPDDSICMYSLDQNCLYPFIEDTQHSEFMYKLEGIGYRHHLYAEGTKADNKTFGRQVDNKGTVQSVNLSKIGSNGSGRVAVNFAKYIDPDSVGTPGTGGTNPLMNRYGQSCLWIHGPRIAEKDKSFIGDVLNHKAPISSAFGYYTVLTRDLLDQYGALDNLSYIPILEAKSFQTSVSGLSGNRYIAPYSFVKTSFISEKVGDYFQIGNKVSGKSDRCLCDNPEDAINSYLGAYIWTVLPKDSDLADAKNWCGLHSLNNATTDTWLEANAKSAPETDYYYPHTLKHLTTFYCETELNPYLVEYSDELENQRYNNFKKQFTLEAATSPWESAYLALFYSKEEQPSYAQKLAKLLILSLINLVLPLVKMEDLLSPQNTGELIGDITGMMGFVAVFLLLSKVVFTNDFVDEFLGIKKCKTDAEGGITVYIEKFFTNFNRASMVFSTIRNLKTYSAVQEFQNCGCEGAQTTNIWISDPQIDSSYIDAFKIVRPNNFETISQSSGKISDLFVINGTLQAHTTDGVYTLMIPQMQINTSTLPLITGQSRIEPNLIIGSSPEGYAGLKSRQHALDCALGRFFLDYEAGILYHYTGTKMDPISMKGAFNFFKDYTRYCNTSSCTDEQNNQYFSLGYDPRLQRVLITKFDVNTESSWTISYDPLEEKFISFHDYYPTKYINSRDKIYLYDKNIDLYKHDSSTHTYGEFFKQFYPTILDSKHVGNFMSYASHVIFTDAHIITDDSILYNQDVTFSEIGFWNSRQTAGVHKLTPVLTVDNNLVSKTKDKSGIIDIHRESNQWKVNELHNYIVNPTGPIVNKPNKCNIFVEPTNYSDTSNRNIQKARHTRLADDWFQTRLTFDNEANSNVKLYIKGVALLTKQ